jgi:quercetin dioxygenase-like cupin family protein
LVFCRSARLDFFGIQKCTLLAHQTLKPTKLQVITTGQDVTPLNQVWSARLSMASGGYVEAKASPAGKLYIVIEGQVNFRGGDTTVELHAGDSVFVLPNEEREFKESAGSNALLYLVMLESYQEHV